MRQNIYQYLELIPALRDSVALSNLPDDDKLVVNNILEAFETILDTIDSKNATIKRLQQIIWGCRSEKSKNILPKAANDSGDADSKAKVNGVNDDAKEDNGHDTSSGVDEQKNSSPTPKRRKGHGRNGAAAYYGATLVQIALNMQNGVTCPTCKCGRIYAADVSKEVFLEGFAPVQATLVERERKTCNLCRKSFVAPMPQEFVGKPKYASSVASIIAALHYSAGLTFYALEKLQANIGVPMPASTQYEIIAEQATHLRPVLDELQRQAAQGDVIHNDDTPMEILSRHHDKNSSEALLQMQICNGADKLSSNAKLRSIKTTGIISILADGKKIALFSTSDAHAGNTLAKILEMRKNGLPPPIHMCDALSENIPQNFTTLLAHCNAHARRGFVDIIDKFPDECAAVVAVFKIIYVTDDKAKDLGLTSEERLKYHEQHSKNPLESLQRRMQEELDNHKVEPNSGLGKAYRYILKHWTELTLFLHQPGVPLDNNICERALKMAIKHRKNSLFYKTAKGAATGDLYMSLIHTCALNGVNAVAYLTALDRHIKHVGNNVASWMPWNYHTTSAQLENISTAFSPAA